MFSHQSQCAGSQLRLDHLLHEFRMRRCQDRCTALSQWGGRESDVSVDVERARLVLREKRVIALFEGDGVDPPLAHQKLAPSVVRIQGQQGVVQVE